MSEQTETAAARVAANYLDLLRKYQELELEVVALRATQRTQQEQNALLYAGLEAGQREIARLQGELSRLKGGTE